MRQHIPKYRHLTLTSSDEIAAYMHVTRIRMLQSLIAHGPATISQVAAKLEVHPANLTRHMRTLEKAGLAALVEKRDTGRNLEKYYVATADSFDVAPDVQNLKAPHKIGLAMARSDLSAALAHLPDKAADEVSIRLASVHISDENMAAFRQELLALAARFEAAEDSQGAPYHLLLGLYPGGHTADMPKQRIEIKRKQDK